MDREMSEDRKLINTPGECVRLAEEHADTAEGYRTVIFRGGTFVRVAAEELEYGETPERYARQRLREAAGEGELRCERLAERSQTGDILCLAYQAPSLSGSNGVYNYYWSAADWPDEDEELISGYRAQDMDELEIVEVI